MTNVLNDVIKNAIKAMEIGDERFSSSQAIRQWITKHHPGRFSKEQVQGGLRALVEKGQLIHDRHSLGSPSRAAQRASRSAARKAQVESGGEAHEHAKGGTSSGAKRGLQAEVELGADRSTRSGKPPNRRPEPARVAASKAQGQESEVARLQEELRIEKAQRALLAKRYAELKASASEGGESQAEEAQQAIAALHDLQLAFDVQAAELRLLKRKLAASPSAPTPRASPRALLTHDHFHNAADDSYYERAAARASAAQREAEQEDDADGGYEELDPREGMHAVPTQPAGTKRPALPPPRPVARIGHRRRKFSPAEKRDVVRGVIKQPQLPNGRRNWEAILKDPTLHFHEQRSAVDLKDCFRTVLRRYYGGDEAALLADQDGAAIADEEIDAMAVAAS